MAKFTTHNPLTIRSLLPQEQHQNKICKIEELFLELLGSAIVLIDIWLSHSANRNFYERYALFLKMFSSQSYFGIYSYVSNF